jgi:hypothetical protein
MDSDAPQGVLEEVALLQEITEAARATVRAFVDDRTDASGRVSKDSFANFARMTGLQAQPWEKALKVSEHHGVRARYAALNKDSMSRVVQCCSPSAGVQSGPGRGGCMVLILLNLHACPQPPHLKEGSGGCSRVCHYA